MLYCMRLTATTRLLLTAMLWTGAIMLIALTVQSFGIRSLLLALVPLLATGWFYGTMVGGIAGALFFAGGWVVSSSGQLAPPTLDQQLLFLVLGTLGALMGTVAALKRRHDRHERASSAARFDALTGLQTRAAFKEELAGLLEAARHGDTQVALLFIDLDRFKIVNDTYGHDIGDQLLQSIAARISGHGHGSDLVGRLGGDEFVLAISGYANTSAIAARARMLLATLGSPVQIEGKPIRIGASIGISVYPTDGDNVESLIKFADRAMYQVKSGGRNFFTFSTDDMRQQRNRQLDVEGRLLNAMAAGEFSVRYQPQFDLRSQRLVGFEALLRWHNPELGEITPDEFIPIAEDSGAIVQLGHWLLREVCQQAAAWRRAGLVPVRMAVNVSPVQFMHPDFHNHVNDAKGDAGMLPNSLEIEITEGILLRDAEMVVRTLKRLRRMEVRSVLDDFGTGYSSLQYLEQLPVASLKIPQNFVSGLGRRDQRLGDSGRSSSAIVEAICALAHKLSKVVVAEGIETEYQRTFLRDIGCDIGQGFLMAAPLGVKAAERLQIEQASQHTLAPRAVPTQLADLFLPD